MRVSLRLPSTYPSGYTRNVSTRICGMYVLRSDRRWMCLTLSVFLIISCFTVMLHQRSGLSSKTDLLTNSSMQGAVPINVDLAVSLQYAAVIDAGSSGSRIYLYTWPPHTGNPHDLLTLQPLRGEDGEPLHDKVSPGLSDVSDRPWEATKYMSPLLSFAAENIPKEKHKETPLYILATAGMRLLQKVEQEAILDNLRVDIPRNFSFYFPANNVEIISGKQEGVYQWIAINFALGRFDHSNADSFIAVDLPATDTKSSSQGMVFRPRTVGAIDMGGASLQVAFEITNSMQRNGMKDYDKSHVVEVNLGCMEHNTEHMYTLYVATFLGYGANEALQRHQLTTVRQQFTENPDSIIGTDIRQPLSDPCLPYDMMDNMTVTFDPNKLPEKLKATFSKPADFFFRGTGNWDACYSALQQHLDAGNSSDACIEKFCPKIGPLWTPPITYQNTDFYGFSEFWYSMEDVLRMGGPYKFDQFRAAAKEFCGTQWSTLIDRFKRKLYPKADEHRLRYQCFKSVWLSVVVHNVLKFPKAYTHLTASPVTVRGQVVHWTIGALLYRTRYFPLRALEQSSLQQVHHGIYHPPWESGYLYSYYIVLVCFLLVLAAILLYLRRLRRYMKTDLKRVPTMSYFMTEQDELEMGVHIQEANTNDIYIR